MARLGMDVELVRADAEQMDRLATSLHALVGSINGSVGRMGSGWFGPDAEQLVHRWQRQSRPALEALAQEVHRLAGVARNEAQAQEATSGGLLGGGSASSGPYPQSWAALGTSSPSLLDDANFELALIGIGVTLTQLRNLHLPTSALRLGVLSQLSEVGKLAAMSKILGRFGVAVDAITFANDLRTGTDPWHTAYDGAHLVVNTVGLFVPVVGLGLGAWDVGTYLGARIAEIPAVHHQIDRFGDGALDEGAKAAGGDPHTDPAAARRLVERYEGPAGFFHAMGDGAAGVGNKIKGLLHR